MTPEPHGHYRCLYVAALETPEFQRLSAGAQHVLLVLTLGPTVSRCYPCSLPDLQARTGRREPELRRILAELQRRPSRKTAFIVYDGRHVFVRRALRQDPGSPLSSKNLVRGIEKQILDLPQHSVVIEAFKREYPLPAWAPESNPSPNPSPNPSGNPSPKGSPIPEPEPEPEPEPDPEPDPLGCLLTQFRSTENGSNRQPSREEQLDALARSQGQTRDMLRDAIDRERKRQGVR